MKTFALRDRFQGFEHVELVPYDPAVMSPETPVQTVRCWTPPRELICRCGAYVLHWHESADGTRLLSVYDSPARKVTS